MKKQDDLISVDLREINSKSDPKDIEIAMLKARHIFERVNGYNKAASDIKEKLPDLYKKKKNIDQKKNAKKPRKLSTLKNFVIATKSKNINSLKKYLCIDKSRDLCEEKDIPFEIIQWEEDNDGRYKLSYRDRGKEKTVSEKRLINILTEINK